MKVLLDTNVILDIALVRLPFYRTHLGSYALAKCFSINPYKAEIDLGSGMI